MRRFILIIILISSPLLATEPDPGAVHKMLQAGQYEAALAELDRFLPGTEYFPWAVQESARAYYRLEKWAQFFGMAYYSRKVLPVCEESEKVRLLEVLAFMRHCQISVAKEIWMARELPQDAGLRRQFDALRELLQIPPNLTPAPKIEDHTQKPRGIFGTGDMWPASALSLTRLDPHRLRRVVRNQCDAKAPLEKEAR